MSRTRQHGAAAACAGCAQARGQAIWKPAAQALGLEGSMSAGPGSWGTPGCTLATEGPLPGPWAPAVMAYAPQVFRALSAGPVAGRVRAQPLGAPRAGEDVATLPLGPPPRVVGLSVWRGSA